MLAEAALFLAAVAQAPPAKATYEAIADPAPYRVPKGLSYPDCKVPRPRVLDQLVVVGGYDGAAVSTVSVAGQDEDTRVAEIFAGAGTKPIYLVVTAYDPIIFRLGGDLSRLRQLVVIYSKSAGVVGVPRDKIHFVEHARCPIPFVVEGRSPEWDVPVQLMFGRRANLQGGQEHLRKTVITDELLTIDQWPRVPRRADLSPLENAFQMYIPEGIVALEPEQIIATSKAERYEVLPSSAGAVQLERSGALARPSQEVLRRVKERLVANGKVPAHLDPFEAPYVVTRPIRVPADLCGGHSLDFIVPAPDYLSGDVCHSNVYTFDGQVLAGRFHGFGVKSEPIPRESYPNCSLPKVADDEDLVVIGGNRGAALSMVAANGQDEETSLADIVIESGGRPLYIVLSVGGPIIYRLSGDVQRVRRVVALSSGDEKRAAFIGAPRGTALFADSRDCPVDQGVFRQMTPEQDAIIRTVFGRTARLQGGDGMVRRIVIGSNWLSARALPPARVAPEPLLGTHFLYHYPAGLITIDPRTVAGRGRIEVYEVPPEDAGSMHLIQTGVLVPAGAEDVERWKKQAIEGGHFTPEQVSDMLFWRLFRVTRPTRLPAGLCGGHVLSLFAASPDLVRGDPCHSSVYVDDGTKIGL